MSRDPSTSPTVTRLHPRLDNLPPEVSEEPPPAIMERFRSYMTETMKGYKFSEALQTRMDFQNPYLLEEIVRQFNIDETASNYPPRLFDPKGFKESDFIEAISAAQLKAEEDRAAAQSQRTSLSFVSGGMQLSSLGGSAAGSALLRAGSSSSSSGSVAAMNPVLSAALAAAREAAVAVAANAKRGADAATTKDSEPAAKRKSKWDN